jgi:predicted protein tyrosine phosphatase
MAKNERFEIFKKHGVLILPESIAKYYHPSLDTVLIRIKDEEPEPFLFEKYYLDVLKLVFDDVSSPTPYGKLMTKEDAKKVVDFFVKHKDKKLVVHCVAGISRSTATACAWAYYHKNQELEREIRTCPLFSPNSHVYSLLCRQIDALSI